MTPSSGKVSYRQKSARPTNKVVATGLAGAITTIIVWILNTFVLPEPMPAEVVAALTTIIAVLVAYFVPPGAEDQIIEVSK